VTFVGGWRGQRRPTGPNRPRGGSRLEEHLCEPPREAGQEPLRGSRAAYMTSAAAWCAASLWCC
jgi:hypothetical protein